MIRTAKKVIVLLCWILLFAGMSGCLSGGAQEERISVAFQVVAFDKAPQKLQEIIEEHKKEEIKMTWEGDEGRYIIRGYGEQPTGGYSIRAAAVELMGGTPQQCLDAASTVLMNMLGLVCDPVGGLVEYPCQNRNAAGVANALIAAELSLSGIRQLIPFDQMLDAMYAVGKRLPAELRETALGGCAATPAACAACGLCSGN